MDTWEKYQPDILKRSKQLYWQTLESQEALIKYLVQHAVNVKHFSEH